MAVDGIILNKVVKDLQARFPARINKIYQISRDEVLFNIRTNGEKKVLLISTHSNYNRIHLTNREYDTLQEPTSFNLLLRKYLEGGTIFSINQAGLDRYLTMEVSHRDQIGDKHTITIYVELMGKYANLILVDENNKIIDALKRIPPYENSNRTIWPGADYVKAEPQFKKDPFKEEHFDPSVSLIQTYHGFSPLLARELDFRLAKQSFKEVMNEIASSQSIYISNINSEFQYHTIPLTHLGSDYEEYNIHEGFDVFYFQIANRERIKQVTGNLLKIVKRQIKNLEKKLPKLQVQYEQSLNCDINKEYGDYLIMESNNQNPKGINSITVRDFENNEITIKLNEKFDLKTNAKKYYQKYNKLKKGQSHLIEQIEITEDEILYLNAILEQLEIASVKDASEIKEELIKNRYLKSKLKKQKINKKKKKKNIPNITTIEHNGYLITYGKNNIQNDYVTFKHAKKDYTWFHAKDFHGSHVVVNSNDLDEDIIRFCANIAAYYSKGRFSSSVPVNYCQVSKLKKIPKSKIGLVQLSNYQTIYIDPEKV